MGNAASLLRQVLDRFRNRVFIFAHHCFLLLRSLLKLQISLVNTIHVVSPIAEISTMLSNIAAFSHKELNAFLVSSLLCVATSVLRCLLRLRLIFRTSSAKTLLTMPLSHIAYASQFLPLRQNPCEQLEVLRISADRWAKAWQGKLRVPAALPSVHTAPCSLPPSFLSEVFQDTYVALYKKAC